MRAYKLSRKRKDGTYGSLFISRRDRLPIGEWLEAELHPTKGYKVRPGWHCVPGAWAPHLKSLTEERIWLDVEIEDYETEERPKSQGGTWYLAKWMKILGEAGPRCKYCNGTPDYLIDSSTEYECSFCHAVQQRPGNLNDNDILIKSMKLRGYTIHDITSEHYKQLMMKERSKEQNLIIEKQFK